MKAKRILALCMASVLCAASLASCSGGGSDSGDSKKTTIKVVTMFGGTDPNVKTYNKIIKQFEKDHPDVKIEDNSATSTEDWKAQVAADFSVGNEPDVLQFFTDANGDAIYKAKQFVSVEEIQKKYPEYAADILPEALEAVTRKEDKKAYAVPTTGYYEGLFCNKDLFEQYNLELPTDWEKFTTAIRTFHENDVIPVSASLMEVPHYWIEHLILSEGGISEHKKNPTDKAPDSWVKGLDYFKTLRDMNAFPVDTDSIKDAAAGDYFKQGKSAMQLDGSWFANGLTGEDMVANQDNVTILPVPTVPGGKKNESDIITGFSTGFHITKSAWDDSKKQKAAVEFVMANTSTDAIAEYWQGAGTPAAACEVPEGLSALLNDGATLASQASGTDSAIDSRLKPEAWKTLTGEISAISSGKKTAEDVLKEVVKINAE